MRKRKLTILLAFLMASMISLGQKLSSNYCGTEQYHLYLSEKYLIEDQEIEKEYRQSQISGAQKLNSTPIIPVVVHIIHQNGAENLSDLQIQNTIAALNEMMANEGIYYHEQHIDTEISLCLAQRTPANEPTIGINRISSSLTNTHRPNTDAQLKSLINWDGRDYLNIWLVREISGDNFDPAGYSSFPSVHGFGMDGIVMEARYFNENLDHLEILTHELGHYLGLLHTFNGGCKNDNCLIDGDRVCDTPPDGSNDVTLCQSGINTCHTDEDDPSNNNPFRSSANGGLGDQPDQIENFMDYGLNRCQHKFTQGQKDRMLFFLTGIRQSLITSKSCLEPCPTEISIDFLPNDTIVQLGLPIVFYAQGSQYSSLEWSVNGTAVGNQEELSYTFLNEGAYHLELIAFTDDPRCDTVWVSYEIIAQCPVEAGVDVQIINDTLQVNNQSIGHVSHEIQVFDPDENVFGQSSLDNIDFSLTAPGWYQVCIIAQGLSCADTTCTHIRYYGGQEENCALEGDEDGDGLANQFDPDCACQDTLYHAGCLINCEYIPTSDSIEIKLKWRSPLIGKFRSTGYNPFVVGKSPKSDTVLLVMATQNSQWPDRPFNRQQLWILDPYTGAKKREITAFDSVEVSVSNNLVLADIHNGVPSILFYASDSDNTLIAQSVEGRAIYEYRGTDGRSFESTNIADFNMDGIPEIYSGRAINNALNGEQLLRGQYGAGQGRDDNFPFKPLGHTLAADVLPHPGLELLAGNTVYTVEINNLNGMAGNVITPHFPNDASMLDGYTATGDFDLDGDLDVVVVNGVSPPNDPRDRQGGIWIWNPRTGNTISESNYQGASYGAGIPFVGDVDGDCVPEIGAVFINELVLFEYDGTQQLKLKYRIPTTDGSGFTGITMFDFNQDGRNELVYRDETDLRIIEGATGRTLASYPVNSFTGQEYPVIADIDNDGQAEILITGHEGNVSNEVYLYAFESAGAPWAPARPVWNQYAYHSTNINDDLTVPRVQQNMAKPLQGYEDCLRETCPAPYNGFLVQSTYRTQAGCVQFPAVDLSVEVMGYDCGPDSTTFYLQVCNGSNGKSVREEFCVSLYEDLSSPGYSEVFCLGQQVDTMGCSDTIELRIPAPGSLDRLYIAVNDDGSGASPAAFPVTNLVECNYQNNIDTIELDISPRTLDLGPEIGKCESEVITLRAPSGFDRYLWSDLTNDSLYSSAAEGLHWLEATDQCGRVYRDTVLFSIDRQDELDLPEEFDGCPGDSIGLLVNDSDYESIQWFPSGAVGCDTCFITSLFIQDSITELIGVTQNGACVYVDTILLQPTVGIEIKQTAEICQGDSLRFFDQIASETGTYRHTTADCDSSFVLELETLENSVFSYQEEICQGDSLLFDGLWRRAEGSYTQMLTAANGCDSMLTLELELLPQDTSSLSEDLCEGDSLILVGETYTQAGDYELRELNRFGCDSLIRLSLAVYNKDTMSIEREYCRGDSLLFDGRWYSSPDTYELMYTNSYGCDSLLRLQVTEVDTLKEQAEYLLCPGDSVEIAGQWIDQSGVYPFNLSSLAGCDSTFTAEVEVLLSPERPTTEIDCEEGLAILSLPENALWGVLWDNGDTSWVTQYNASGRVEAMRSADPGCTVVQELEIPSLPEISFIPNFNDTLIDYNESIMVSAGVDPQDWEIRWTPDNLMSCATCTETEISPIDGQEIMLELIHSSGCTYSRSFQINVKEEDRPDIFIPNAFSPNDDGNNDSWQIYLPEGIDQIDKAMLFDRWGNKIAEWQNTADVVWDGRYRDKPMNPGVFVYVVEYRDALGQQQVKSGDVTLVR